MIVDFHTHIFPPKIAATAIESLESNIIEVFGTPQNAVIGATIDDLLNSMKANGIDYSVVLPIATNTHQSTTINNYAAEIDKLLQLACEYMSRDMEYYRMLTQSNLLNNFVVRLINIYYDKLFDSLHEKYPDYDRNEIDLYLLYISSGTKTVLMSWLNGDIKGAPSDISAKLSRLINCSRSFL